LLKVDSQAVLRLLPLTGIQYKCYDN